MKWSQIEAIEDRDDKNVWRVEALNPKGDGECYVTIFSGPLARERAKEYYQFLCGLSWRTESA